MFRRMTVNWIVLFDIGFIIITSGEFGTRFKIQWNSHSKVANTPNHTEIYTCQQCDFIALWGKLFRFQDVHVFGSTTSGALNSSIGLCSVYLKHHWFASNLFVSIWKYLEQSAWLFRVGEFFSCDTQIILHFANVTCMNLTVLW